MTRQSGFTLIEIAIVLVIIGLLLGGILKGQELITGAKVRNLISQVDGVKAAFFGFQDRYRAYPGDYSQAVANIAGVVATGDGNGNGRIETAAASGKCCDESVLVWDHLSHAGFITGTYTAVPTGTTPSNSSNPSNPYNVIIQLAYDMDYSDGASAADTATVPRHNVKTGNQIPVEIIAEVDRKVDDGRANTGGFRGSIYNNLNGGGGTSGDKCWDTSPGNVGAWRVTSGISNCGGASLL